MNAEEAQLRAIRDQFHTFDDIRTVAKTITPSPGRRIIIQSWWSQTNATVTNATVTFASTGKPSVIYRGPSGKPQPQGFPYFAAAVDQPVTVTLAGATGGTYFELSTGYLEI